MKDEFADPIVPELEREWTARAKHTITLRGLLSAWDQFTREVATGYRGGIHDYANDLTARDMVAEAASQSSSVAAQIASQLAQCDERLWAATIPHPTSILGFPRQSSAWWWFRRPILMGWELAEDFKRLDT